MGRKRERVVEMVDTDQLPKNVANYTALTPLWLLERAATMHPTRNSLIQGSRRYTWQQTYHRRRRCASAHANNSIRQGKTVAVIAPNILALYEAHFGIPMAGAVLNPVNIRLNASTVAFLLCHCSTAAVIVDQESFSSAEEALKIWSEKAKTFFCHLDMLWAKEPLNTRMSGRALFWGTHLVPLLVQRVWYYITVEPISCL